VGAGADRRIVAVGRPDQEDQLALARIAQLGDVIGERARRPGLAALIAGDDASPLEVGIQPPLGLVDLDDVDGPEPERAARGGGAGGVVLREPALGRRRELAVNQQGYLQARSSAETSVGAKARGGGSTDQIFSML
jgi:hypothetical protein